MKSFVTGGAGFIGSHLVDKLVSLGAVTVYDNLSSGAEEFIEQHFRRDDFRFVRADLLGLDALKESMKGHDVVFHMAASPDIRAGIEDTRLYLMQGTIVTYNVLEAMRVNGIRNVVFASSSTVHGETPLKPIPEDYGFPQPISLYGASKLAGEGLISAFCHLFSMQAWTYRFANVVGSRATHGVIFDFIKKLTRDSRELEILGNGRQEKPYIHVDECVDGMLYGFQHARDWLNVFNLGCPSTTRVSTIASMVIEEMGLKDVKFRYTGGERGWPGDVPQVRFDTSRMENLGWKPKYTSDEAVRKAMRDILDKRSS
jgi:UDP-glucose 4-epimerase